MLTFCRQVLRSEVQLPFERRISSRPQIYVHSRKKWPRQSNQITYNVCYKHLLGRSFLSILRIAQLDLALLGVQRTLRTLRSSSALFLSCCLSRQYTLVAVFSAITCRWLSVCLARSFPGCWTRTSSALHWFHISL